LLPQYGQHVLERLVKLPYRSHVLGALRQNGLELGDQCYDRVRIANDVIDELGRVAGQGAGQWMQAAVGIAIIAFHVTSLQWRSWATISAGASGWASSSLSMSANPKPSLARLALSSVSGSESLATQLSLAACNSQIAHIALIYDLTVVTRNSDAFVSSGVRSLSPFR